MALLRDMGDGSIEVALAGGRFTVPRPAGVLVADAPLAKLTWFRTGGPAELLFEPADVDDLARFLAALPEGVPVNGLGLGSNLIVRDGGVPGLIVRLGKSFARVERADATTLRLGGGVSGILAASSARDAGIAGLEFLRGIPGTVGGFVRMNGGAYGREVADILVSCEVIMRDGSRRQFSNAELGYRYRHSELPEGAIVTHAVLRGTPGEPVAIGAEMDRIAAAREQSQPLRTRTGGSTFKNPGAGHLAGKNPDGAKAWELVDRAGCRGLRIGDAQVSEKHCNFLINCGSATSAEIEELGEEVRRRVRETTGVTLEWEIRRLGDFAPAAEAVQS